MNCKLSLRGKGMRILVYGDSLIHDLADANKINADTVYDLSPNGGGFVDALAEGEDKINQLTNAGYYNYTLVSVGYFDIYYAKAVYDQVHPDYLAKKIVKLVSHIAGKNAKRVKFVSIQPLDDMPRMKELFDGDLETADSIIRETNQKIKEGLAKKGIDFVDAYSALVNNRTHQINLKYLSGYGGINNAGKDVIARAIERSIWQSELPEQKENV